VTFPVVYEPAARDSGGPTPGARALMAAILRIAPPATDLGIYNNRDQRGTKVTSLHAEGRAIDVGYPDRGLAGHPTGWRLANLLVAHHATLGVQCVIYCRRIWSTARLTAGWRPYSGKDPHTGHLHVELTRAAAARLTPTAAATALTTTTEGDPMAAPDVEAAQRMLNAWLTPDRQLTTDGDWGPASTAALRDILDRADRRIKELEAALTNQAGTGNAEALRKLTELRAALLEVIG